MSSILTASANNVTQLLAGRVVVGIAIGLFTTTIPLYITDIGPDRLRGRLITGTVCLIAAGQLVAALVDGVFAYASESGWRYMFGVGTIPALIQFSGFVFMPESPRWLIKNGRYEEARAALRAIRDRGADVNEEFDVERVSIDEQVRAGTPDSSSIWRELIRQPGLRRALVVGCGLHMVQQLIGTNIVIYYSATIIQLAGVRDTTVVIWISSLVFAINLLATLIGLGLVERIGRRPLTLFSLLGVLVGLVIMAIGFQLTTLNTPLVTYEEKHVSSEDTGVCHPYLTCEACVEDVSCGYCYVLGDDSSAIQGSCSQVRPSPLDISHAIEGRCANMTGASDLNLHWTYDHCPSWFTWVPLMGLMLYLVFYGQGMGTMPWTVNSEIYPSKFRHAGFALASAVNFFCSLLVGSTFLLFIEVMPKYGKLFPTLLNTVRSLILEPELDLLPREIIGIFWMYAVIAALGLFFILFLLPETKGKSIEELEGMFATPWKPSENSLLAPVEKAVQYVHIRGLNRDGRNMSVDSDSD
ncbi:hypothetical protein RvY_02699-2 [Ramazzottius varieornatus]|uniref:Major facilitator superfamily (MFS) profile domain-containing protein n=1 Tax=Ramazzottius varieornatus TaxID=947166 RepID=A0A1D1UV64_RAMVA|nr:hypothetical protein RvY_02699-2 [Ramazzottius varieornatus]